MTDTPSRPVIVSRGDWHCAVCGAEIGALINADGTITIRLDGPCCDRDVCMGRTRSFTAHLYNESFNPPDRLQ